VDLGIDDLHCVLSSRGVPSASGAVLARQFQGPSVARPSFMTRASDSRVIQRHQARYKVWPPLMVRAY
jgi:hypothetical protein